MKFLQYIQLLNDVGNKKNHIQPGESYYFARRSWIENKEILDVWYTIDNIYSVNDKYRSNFSLILTMESHAMQGHSVEVPF